MKKLLSIIGGLVVFVLLMTVSSCGRGNHYVIDSNGALYCSLEQTITVTATEECSFSSSISSKDVSFKSLTKNISSVTYVSSSEIKVTCSGDVEINSDGDYYYAVLNINGGMNGDTAECLVTVRNYHPSLYASLTGSSKLGNKESYTMKLSLPYGNFVDSNCTASNITLPNDNGKLTITLDDGCLVLRVSDFIPTEAAPNTIVKISANCTSFNKDLYVYIGKSGSYPLN